MRTSRLGLVMATIGLVGLMGATGCETSKRSTVRETSGTGVTTQEKRTETFKDTRAPQEEREGPLARILPDSPMRQPTQTAAPAPAPRPTGCIPGGMVRSALAFPTGDVRTSSINLEMGLPPQVNKGEEFEYIICVTNLTGIDLEDVTITDSFSTGFEVISSSPSWDSKQGSTVEWVYDVLPARDQRIIRVKARGTTEGTINVCASATFRPGVCIATNVVSPALQLAKTATREVLECDPITITYTVTNSGSGAASNVVINDTLPNGLTIDGSSRVSIPVGTLAAGQSREVSKQAVASRTGRLGSAASASAEPNLSADSNEVATVVKKPVLELEQSCPELRFFGRDAEVDLVVRNTGDGVARNVMLEASLPSATRFVGATGQGRLQGNKVVWNLGDLAPNASRSVDFDFTSDVAGNYRIQSMTQGYCADAVREDCTVRFEGIPAILVECIDLEDPDEVGTDETYVITVTNQGTAPDTNIRVVCEIPDKMSYASSSGPTTASVRGRTVTFAPLATLAPKAQAVWRVTVNCNEPGDVRFRIAVTSDEFNDPPIEETESTNLYE